MKKHEKINFEYLGKSVETITTFPTHMPTQKLFTVSTLVVVLYIKIKNVKNKVLISPLISGRDKNIV